MRGGKCGHLRQHLIEFNTREQLPVEYNGEYFSRVLDVCKRIRIEQHQIGQLALFYCTKLVFQSKKAGWITSGRLQCLHGSKTRPDKVFELRLQAESGKHVHRGGGVSAGQKPHSRLMHRAYDLKFFLHKLPAVSNRVSIKIRQDALCKLRP